MTNAIDPIVKIAIAIDFSSSWLLCRVFSCFICLLSSFLLRHSEFVNITSAPPYACTQDLGTLYSPREPWLVIIIIVSSLLGGAAITFPAG